MKFQSSLHALERKKETMDSSRRTSSRQDTTTHSSREASSHPKPLDLTRHAAAQEGSSSGYYRAYNTFDALHSSSSAQPHFEGQSSAGSPGWPTNDAAVQEGSSSGYHRAYNTFDAQQRSSRNVPTLTDWQQSSTRPLPFSSPPLQEISSQTPGTDPLGEILRASRPDHTLESLFESPASQTQPTGWTPETFYQRGQETRSGLLGDIVSQSHRSTFADKPRSSTGGGSFAGSQGQERSSRSFLQDPMRALKASFNRLRFATGQTQEISYQTQKTTDRGLLGEIFATSSQGHAQESPFESQRSQSQPTVPLQETSYQGESHGFLGDAVSGSRRTEQTQGTGTRSGDFAGSSHPSLGQTSEQRAITLGPELREPDQAGSSRQTDTPPSRAEQISLLIYTLLMTQNQPSRWQMWPQGDIRRTFRENKMNQTEYKYASTELSSMGLDKNTAINVRDALRRTYREASKRSSVTGSEAQGQERSPSPSSRQNPIGSFRPSKRPFEASTTLTWETSHQTQKLRDSDQAGSSRQGDSHRESTSQQERTWTTQQLHQLVDEMVQIENFDHRTFRNALTEESKAIFNELNSKYKSDRKSFTNQEMNDIETRFKSYKVKFEDKRRKHLRTKSAHARSLQNIREHTSMIKAIEEGFKNRTHRSRSRQKSSKDDLELS